MRANTTYPIIDLFAGPGGLGEGFSELYNEDNSRVFNSVASIERDEFAHQTLLLRHFFKSFARGKVPSDYYSYLAGKIHKHELINRNKENWEHAKESALKISLGQDTHVEVCDLITDKLESRKKWALIGGPPCQAYSLVGRSRMMGTPGFEEDERHFLYKEYLKIIADHQPPVFVMENVKGLLSARVGGVRVIEKIVADLRNPVSAIHNKAAPLKYKLYSLSQGEEVVADIDPKSFIVKAEEFGVPQARHRMFILGIRDDVDVKPKILSKKKAPTVIDVIGNLPKIRSGISRRKDDLDDWKNAIVTANASKWINGNVADDQNNIKAEITNAIKRIKACSLERSERKYTPSNILNSWFYDKNLEFITSHEARAHMIGDLHRYLYASSYAAIFDVSPKLKDFPTQLLPKHKNVDVGCEGKMFSDRFRVQVKSRVSTTITSHISKDGHYFIHYDPEQCRSLSVREAARLQTFPDNYHFEGPRTAQYHQVGNAVPPYLAMQIAEVVKDVLEQMPCD